MTSTSTYVANTQGATCSIFLDGVLVVLPDIQLLSPGITNSGTNDTFTVRTL